MNRKESIYFRLLKLLVLAALIAGTVFCLMRGAGTYFLNHYFETSDYMERKNNARVNALQDYVTQHEAATTDSELLTRWVYQEKVRFMQVYRNSILVYDSNYTGEAETLEISADGGHYDWEIYCGISFSDGEAEVILCGFYERKFYGYALIGEMLLSVFLFFVIVMLGIRRTMKYITQLSREIEILEGGNLEYEVTVKGRDELAALARGIDDMRRSFAQQVEQEARLTQANRKMITEMSHDLRTPLTSMMIYVEILKNHRYQNETQMQEYLDRIDKKMHQLKQLSEHIFEYSLVGSEMEVELEEPEDFRNLFYDLLSEVAAYLEQNGFTVELKMDWGESRVQIHEGYLARVLDNILSNLLKYADPDAPIAIAVRDADGKACVCFENCVRKLAHKEDSTNIGLQNTKRMMQKMRGSCQTQESGECFRTELCFFAVSDALS